MKGKIKLRNQNKIKNRPAKGWAILKFGFERENSFIFA
jgi:hypothetical protein